MSQAFKSSQAVTNAAAAAAAEQMRLADISDQTTEGEALPTPTYDGDEQKRQALWRAQMKRRRESESRKAKRGAANGAGAGGGRGAGGDDERASSSSFQTLEESVRQTVVVALLAQEGDPRTKIGHWRVKDVGGVKQACFKNQIASELCYNIALGVHYLLQKAPPDHEPDPFCEPSPAPTMIWSDLICLNLISRPI